MEIDNYASDDNILEQDIVDVTNEDLSWLKTDVLSNDIEDFDKLSLEELYNESYEIENRLYKFKSKAKNGLDRKIRNCEMYLKNYDIGWEEKEEELNLINKYKKQIENLPTEKENLESRKSRIDLELEKRLENTEELNEWFLKTFNFLMSPENKKHRLSSRIVKENWNEIWKEFKIDGVCLFKDNDGNYYKSYTDIENIDVENIKEWEKEKITNLKDVCHYLRMIDNELDNSVSISDAIKSLYEFADLTWIWEEILEEYKNKIIKSGEIPSILDDSLKEQLWFESITSEITPAQWLLLFQVRKVCPNTYKEILPLIYNIFKCNRGFICNNYGLLKRAINSIKFYWDTSYEYLRFCSPFDWSYIKESVSHLHGKRFWETLDEMKQRINSDEYLYWADADEIIRTTQNEVNNECMLIQYVENFAQEPESINLFSFINENPQKLCNLWWKVVKEIDLDINLWINFAFRGIIEMVKSRPDINFPHLKEKYTELEKIKWKQQREKIIKEYENMLRNYISKDKEQNYEKNGKTFDKIFFSLDWGEKNSMPSKERVQQFSWNEVLDYWHGNERIIMPKWWTEWTTEMKMISDVESYAKLHPKENILVCINQHGAPDGSSGNWWSKEDWLRLANISPNIKIWSVRCFFWTAFPNKDIYKQQSPVSWFSNNTVSLAHVSEIINDASNKNLWFHEMEIYTRLNYPITVCPLTESMEYTDWNTWEKEIGKIWLARNDESNWNDIHRNDYSYSV